MMVNSNIPFHSYNILPLNNKVEPAPVIVNVTVPFVLSPVTVKAETAPPDIIVAILIPCAPLETAHIVRSPQSSFENKYIDGFRRLYVLD